MQYRENVSKRAMPGLGRKNNNLEKNQFGPFSRLQETLDQALREEEISTALTATSKLHIQQPPRIAASVLQLLLQHNCF